MANINESMQSLMTLDGSVAASLVDFNSGMVLGKSGSGIDFDLAAAGHSELVRAKLKTMRALKLGDAIEDILITLGQQYHVIRPLAKKAGLYFYVVLDKAKSNLTAARFKAAEVEADLSI